MTTAVNICSNALMMVGDKPISDVDEATPRARVASSLYADVRDATLRSHPWNCARKRVILSPDAVPPAFGYTHQFTMPADWLRTLSAGPYKCDRPEFTIEGQKILAYGNAISLLYIFRNETESTWDGLLVDAMTFALAARLAYPIAKSTSLAQAMEQKFQAVLKSARAVNGQDTPPETFGDFPLLESRLVDNSVGFGGRFDRFESAD